MPKKVLLVVPDCRLGRTVMKRNMHIFTQSAELGTSPVIT